MFSDNDGNLNNPSHDEPVITGVTQPQLEVPKAREETSVGAPAAAAAAIAMAGIAGHLHSVAGSTAVSQVTYYFILSVISAALPRVLGQPRDFKLTANTCDWDRHSLR